MNHDIKHEEKQNAAIRFIAGELGKHVRKEVDLLLGSDEAAPVAPVAPAAASDDVPAISLQPAVKADA